MNPRIALIFLLTIVCLVAWWQVETRITAAQDLNQKLSVEAAHLVAPEEDPPPQPDFTPSPSARPLTASSPIQPSANLPLSADEPETQASD